MGGGASKVAPKNNTADYEQLKRDYAALKKAHEDTLAFHGESGPRYASDDKVPPLVSQTSPKRPVSKLRKQATTNMIRGTSKMKIVAKERQRQSSIREQVESLQSDLPHVRKVFDELAHKAEPTDEIGFKEFGEVLNKRLHLDLGAHELKRIWDALFADDNSKGAKKTAPEERALDFEGFASALDRLSFLRDVVTRLSAEELPFDIPSTYDWTVSTNDNYRAAEADGFHGEYVDVREARDYSYHVNYTRERQLWQDTVIKAAVTRTDPQPAPWIVYTCGPAGAGKGFALSWMSQHGYFPLEYIVHIDSDQFKQVMPEWDEYVARDRDGGASLMHRESGYLQEIAQEVAMRSQQNVWVDGTLKDGEYYAKVLRAVRQSYPQYKIAIFEVTACEATVRRRIQQRAEKTGRAVPEEIIREALAGVNDSLAILTPLADFVAKISNEETPQLLSISRIDSRGNWSVIQSQFANRVEDPGAFPSSLAPLMLSSMPLVVETSKRGTEVAAADVLQMASSSPASSSGIILEEAAMRPVRGSQQRFVVASFDLRCYPGHAESPFAETTHAQLPLSACHAINLGDEAKETAGIPREAASFAFSYPSPTTPEARGGGRVASDPLSDLLGNGGFIYFDAADRVCCINAIRSLGYQHKLEKGAAAAHARPSLMQFDPPVRLPKATAAALRTQGRLQEVTLSALTLRRCSHFAWILPSERLEGFMDAGGRGDEELAYPPRFGAFCYIFDNCDLGSDQNVYFPIAAMGS